MLPPHRILAPVDFSPCSGASLAFAARLARQCRAELHVLNVEPPLLEAVAQSQQIDLRGETRAALATFTTATAPSDGGQPVYHVEAGPAAATICAVALAQQADLIVMGPRGRSRLAATLLGSTTKGVLQHAPCPVVVVPARWTPADDGSRDTSTSAVIVGVEDVDAPSRPLLEAAARLAVALGVDLHLVHAVNSTAPADIERHRLMLIKHLAVRPLSVTATVHVEEGPASDVLEAYASRTALGRGIVMLGVHGESGPHGALAGWRDTALSLMARLPLPFVACRP